MARISDLREYNGLRIDDRWVPFEQNTISFENQKGETMLVTPLELKEELNKFIDLQFSSMTSEDIEHKKEHLKRELDKKLNEFETSLKQHVEDKINKITQSVIENTTNRIFEDRIKQEVKQRLRKLLEE
jgi:uncharacterized FlaG/YvyC family protein